MKAYAGVGSRETPADVLSLMSRVALRLAALGWTLRSGGASGADSAFEAGAGDAKEIFLPEEGFQGRYSSEPGVYLGREEALEIAARFHPAWARCGAYARRLHARNVHQVLGLNFESPVAFVLCWTRDGTEDRTNLATGGTGQAIRIARGHGVPVFNLKNPGCLERLRSLVLAHETKASG